MLNKLRCHAHFCQPIRLLDLGCWYKFTYKMTNSAVPDQLASSEATWSWLHCLQRQGISGFSRTRVNQEKKKKTLTAAALIISAEKRHRYSILIYFCFSNAFCAKTNTKIKALQALQHTLPLHLHQASAVTLSKIKALRVLIGVVVWTLELIETYVEIRKSNT